MLDASTLQFLFQLAKGVARQFGPNCEVVVHDLASNDPDSSIVAIENGQISGRKVGDGPSHAVLEALRGGKGTVEDHLCYLTRTRDGKILKSTTIYIRDDDGRPIGMFGINYDITLMLAMEDALKQFTATERDEQEPEHISRNVSDLLDELIVLNRQEDLNKYRKRIRYYARIQLLFIDDFAISRYSEEGIKILYHLIKLRDDLGTSTLFSCQYSPDEWGNQLSDEKECYGKLDGIRRRLTTGFTVLIEKA